MGPWTVGEWVDAALAIPRRVEEMWRMTAGMSDALAELQAAVAEVAGDIQTLTERVEQGDTAAVAEIRARAQQLRNLVPDQPATP